MNKTIIILISIIAFYIFIGNISSKVLIPDEALRIRIIANSNSEYDQHIKEEVKKNVEVIIYGLLKSAINVEQAREILNDNITNINQTVENTLQELNTAIDYKTNFGLNYFPEKEYKGVLYKEGYYESLVVTLGEGKGDNWWCVLFPPLCLLEAKESTEIEYKSYVEELIQKYF